MNKVVWAATIVLAFQITNPTFSKAQTDSMKKGFKASCVDVKGMDYRSGEWGKDGYSGQLYVIIFEGGETFQETQAEFPYFVTYLSDTAIVGTGNYKSFAYLMSLNKKSGEMMLSRLGGGGLGSLFVGNCKFRFN
tara:strand:+ start:286 stop:690 length:405 start_codon:yes stop_codon:yes gene_type:complete